MMIDCPRCWGRGAQSAQVVHPCDYCDGKGQVDDVRLSPNFTLAEMVRSSTARARGLRNDPDSIQLRRLRDLCTQLLEPLRAKWGPLLVTSGLRLPAVNAAVGSTMASAHLVGWAADVKPKAGVDYDDVFAWLATSGLAWDQAIHEGTWIHLGLRRPGSGEQRRQLLRMRGGQYLPWAPRTGAVA